MFFFDSFIDFMLLLHIQIEYCVLNLVSLSFLVHFCALFLSLSPFRCRFRCTNRAFPAHLAPGRTKLIIILHLLLFLTVQIIQQLDLIHFRLSLRFEFDCFLSSFASNASVPLCAPRILSLSFHRLFVGPVVRFPRFNRRSFHSTLFYCHSPNRILHSFILLVLLLLLLLLPFLSLLFL